MATFKQKQQTIRAARKAAAKADMRLYKSRLKAQQAKNPTSLADIQSDIAGALRDKALSEQRLSGALSGLINVPDYRKIASNLSARFPIVFFPVRIETRFVDVNGRQQLWVRVYPDDFYIHSFEPELSKPEVTKAKEYWRALATANSASDSDKERLKKEAWKRLTGKLGVQRALWIAKQTTPINWDPTQSNEPETLSFPVLSTDKEQSWTRAPQTQLLPDKFVVQIIKDDEVVRHKVGRAIPDTVFLGPDPFLAESAFKETEKSIQFDESFAWVGDFDKAVAKGLGFKIPVSPSMLNKGQIDKIIVVGLLASASEKDSKLLLEQHLIAQRYSSSGFGFLEQGTPTNNTDKSASTYTRNIDDLPQGFYDASPSTPLSELPDADGLAFAKALGIDPDILGGVRNAEKQEVAESRAMNQAIYPATIGHFLEVLAQPAVSKSAHPKVREFFTSHVSAMGSVPSIRIGDQPYGVLVTSDISAWKEPSGSGFDKSLALILKLLQNKWDSLARANVPFVGKAGDASKILLEILGLHAGSVTYKQRLGHQDDVPMTATNVGDIKIKLQSKQNRMKNFIKGLGYKADSFPFITSMTFYNRNDDIPANFLVDRKAPSKDRFLDKLGSTGGNFIDWLSKTRTAKDIERHNIPSAKPPRSVLYFLLRHSVLLSIQKAALNIYKVKGFDFKRASVEKSLSNFDKSTSDLTGWELINGTPSKVDARALRITEAMGDHVLKLPFNTIAVRQLAIVRRAARRLSKLSTARLHQCLADHLDLCCYRLDAWQTGMFSRRLFEHRSRLGEGIHIAAYGWVENLRPAVKGIVSGVPAQIKPNGGEPVFQTQQNAGFVHTPSLNHATAAGILNAGYVNNASQANPDAFAVNLSSERVRRALHLYEGVQNNQALDALLGYQFERRLHDLTTENSANNLNKYILALREKFPIENVSLPQAGNEAQETVPAYPVVNGLSLIGVKSTDIKNIVIDSNHRSLVLKEIDRLKDSLDAIGDLVMAEGAYHMVQGNSARSAGLMNSFKNVALPPEIDVNRTPRSTQLTVNNGIFVNVGHDDTVAGNAGWPSRHSPRSRAEPGLNKWLADRLGDPRNVECLVSTILEDSTEVNKERVSLAELSLQPIDLIYVIGTDTRAGARTVQELLGREYRDRVIVPEGAQISIVFEIDGLVASQRSFAQVLSLSLTLRNLITTSRPASARDFLPRSSGTNHSLPESLRWDVPELGARLENAIEGFENRLEVVGRKAPNGRMPKNQDNPATLGNFFSRFIQDGRPPDRLESLPITESTQTVLDDFVSTAMSYGINIRNDRSPDRANASSLRSLLASAASVWESSQNKLTLARSKISEAENAENDDIAVRRLIEAFRAILGDDFVAIPCFTFANPDDVRQSLEEDSVSLINFYSTQYEVTPSMAITEWLDSLSHVRPAAMRLSQVSLIAEQQGGDGVEFEAIQLPYKENDNWLAMEFPTVDPETGEPFQLKHHTLSIAVHGLKPTDVSRRQKLLLVDHWSEAVPNASEVTGIAYNYNQPNSNAANAILVAVEPTGSGSWSWDTVTGVITDTLRRAKTRSVEPAHLLEDPILDTLLPMTVAGFDVHETNVSLDFLMTDDILMQEMKRNNFELYKNL